MSPTDTEITNLRTILDTLDEFFESDCEEHEPLDALRDQIRAKIEGQAG